MIDTEPESLYREMGFIGDADGIQCVLCDHHSQVRSEHERHMEVAHGL